MSNTELYDIQGNLIPSEGIVLVLTAGGYGSSTNEDKLGMAGRVCYIKKLKNTCVEVYTPDRLQAFHFLPCELKVEKTLNTGSYTQKNYNSTNNTEPCSGKKSTNMFKNLAHTVRFALMSEPKKSLIKSGIMNEDGTLTTAGFDVLVDILTNKFDDELLAAARIIIEENESKKN